MTATCEHGRINVAALTRFEIVETFAAPLICPSLDDVLTTLACPFWCELPADHDADAQYVRSHRAAVFTIDTRVSVCVVQSINRSEIGSSNVEVEVIVQSDAPLTDREARATWQAMVAAFGRRDEILADPGEM